MAKKFFVAALLVFIFTACVFADFRKDEDPVTAILCDTAYTLRGGEWNIDLTGPVSYGIIDGLQLWTDLYFYFAQALNLQAKWNVVPDSGSMPALTIGGTIGNASYKQTINSTDVKVNLLFWNLSGYVSKKFNDNLWLSASYTYNKFNITGQSAGNSTSLEDTLKTITGSDDPLGVSNASASIVYQISPGARLCLEYLAVIDTLDNNKLNVSSSINPGVTWAFGDSFRLKLFVMTFFGSDTHYFPCVNLAWKIK